MRFCHVISVMSFLSHLFSRVKETKDIKRHLWGPQKMKRWTWKFRKTSEKVLAFYMCCMSSESFRILEEYTDKFSSVNMKVTSFLSCFIKICKHIHWNTSLFQNTLIASWQRYTLIPSPYLLHLWIIMIPERWDSCNGRDHPSCAPLRPGSTSSHTTGRKVTGVKYWLKAAGKILPYSGFVQSLIPYTRGEKWIGKSACVPGCQRKPNFIPFPGRTEIRNTGVTFLVENSCITTPSIRKYSLFL